MEFYKTLLLVGLTTASFSIDSVPAKRKKGCFEGTERSYHSQTQVGIRQKKCDDLRRQAFKGGRSAAICLALGTGKCVLGGSWLGYKYYSTGEIDPAGSFAVGAGLTTLGFGALKCGNVGLLLLKLRGIPSDEALIEKYAVKSRSPQQRMITRSSAQPPANSSGGQSSTELQQVILVSEGEEVPE
jgi:hypothetical protein